MGRKYKQLHDGDGFEIQVKSGMNLCCCDCGLVHRIVFDTKDKGKTILMQIFGNSRATGQRRRFNTFLYNKSKE